MRLSDIAITTRAPARPPQVSIPDDILGTGRLAPLMAQIALDHGPIFRVVPDSGPLAGSDVVYFVGPEASRFVLLTHREHFSNDLGWTPVLGEALGKGLANMDGPEHPRHRAMMSPAFTAECVDRYLPVTRNVIEARTRSWAARGEIDLAEEARAIAFDVAAAALLGLQMGADVDLMRDRFYALLRGFGDEHQALEGHLLELIAASRRASRERPARSVVDMLARARDEGGNALSDEQILAHVNILLVAGHETTTNLAAWVLYLLAIHPQFGRQVDDELAAALGASADRDAVRGSPALTNVIREAGRLHPPVMFLPRGVVADFEFEGYSVAAGTPAFLAVAAGHRLSTIFADPDTFDPTRFAPPREEHKRHPFALLTFGGGPRMCLGFHFAQMEVKALVAHVRRRYRLTPIPGQDVVEMEGVVQCLADGIRVRVRPAEEAFR